MRLNWGNHLFIKEDGYGRMGLGFVKALLYAGHDVYPFTLNEFETPGWYQQARGLSFDRLTVQLCPPHDMKKIPGRSVAFTMHESLNLPDGWVNHVNEKNELLLVPSPWLVDLFEAGGVKVPIEVVPGGIDPVECEPTLRHRNGPYRFLCLADRATRKGYDLAWTAFYKAFDWKNKDVELLIKCRPGSLPGLDFSYNPDARMIIWRDNIDRISDMFAQADAYLCPARCEGFGMTQREAAACGVPSVVLNFSGTADDCDKWAFPLNKYTLVESGMRGSGGKWGEPDLDELVAMMRWLYENQDEARRQAQTKMAWIREHGTYAQSAKVLVQTLDRYFGGPPPADDMLPPMERKNGKREGERVR